MKKISRQERLMDKEARDFKLLLFSDTPLFPDGVLPPQETTPERNQTHTKSLKPKRKYKRLNHSPIKISGPPDNQQKSPSTASHRFLVPNYNHRNTNYQQPSLTKRLLIDDLIEEWPTESKYLTQPKNRVVVVKEKEFDFSNEGFPHELYRVRGVNMVQEYTQRKEQQGRDFDEDTSDDSANSLTIYEKAKACFKPEPDESNAESAGIRHRFIEKRVCEIKAERKGKSTTHPPFAFNKICTHRLN
jgi:hypothetical protein